MVIFLRRLTIRGQPKKWGDKSERLLTKRATHPIDPLQPITVLRQHGCNQVRPVIQAWLKVVLSFEEFGHARNPNFLAMHLKQPAIRQVVQNPGEVFLSDVEA